MKPVLHKGRLTVWKDEKGFGFIQPSDGGQKVFMHISALKQGNRRPQVGDVICYQLTVDEDGKTRACKALIEGATSTKSVLKLSSAETKTIPKPTTKSLFPVLEVLLLSLIPGLGAINFAFKTFNPLPLLVYIVMSLITFVLYADDKSRAKQRQWRIPENTLHLCELTGGWLGAFIAQRKLRHKSSKISYQVVFWMIVSIHIIFWLDWLVFNGKLIDLFLSIASRK